MQRQIEVIYENGVLRPLEPLDLPENQPLTVTIQTVQAEDRLDAECVQEAARSADDRVRLEDVRQALARIPGSMAEAVTAEREER